jgi:hypothetical protein
MMALTTRQKSDAVAILDGAIPQAQRLNAQGKYTQFVARAVYSAHTVGMDEYQGPQGVGYTRFVQCEDADKTLWRYVWHSGPEDRPHDAWIDMTSGST